MMIYKHMEKDKPDIKFNKDIKIIRTKPDINSSKDIEMIKTRATLAKP